MRREAVKSTQIEAVGYDPILGEMEVKFLEKKGRRAKNVVRFKGISQDEMAAFWASPSKGRYLSSVIKGRKAFYYVEGE